MKEDSYSISAVERDVGLSKDVLRVWERRYGFPSPVRDAKGERLYPADQVRRLRLVKRLMDAGHRPGRLLGLTVRQLDALSHEPAADDPPEGAGSGTPEGTEELMALLRRHDADAFIHALQQRLARSGLANFVQDTVAPAAVSIGREWAAGRLHVFEEHLFTELTSRALREAVAALPAGRGTRVILTTLPGEQHALGLLMLEALLALEGAHCIPLGVQMPVLEIAQAAQAHRAGVVALSFSASFPARQVGPGLGQLRAALPRSIGIWAGGAGLRRTKIEGVAVMHSLDDAVAALLAAGS